MTWEVGTRKSVFLEGGIALFFCLLSFLVRFPHFFRAVHDWDESSFILMGSSVLDGHLPYTDILDIKPPLLWWTSGAILGVLGKSVLSFRVGGTICLALAAYFTYRAGRNFFEPSVGGIAAISLILFVGVCPGGVATMSEHIALVPLSLSLFLLSAYELRPSRAFCAGLAMGAACMVRMNLAYAAVALGLGLLARNSFLKPSGSRLRIVKDWAFWLYVLGGFLAVLVTTLPYLATGSIWHWWNGAVTTSLEYSNSQLTTPAIFIRQVQKVLEAPFNTSMSPSVGIWYGIWLGASFGLARVLYQWRASITNGSFLVLFLLGGVQVSFLRGGVFYTHYSMQLAPALCLLVQRPESSSLPLRR